MNRLWKWENKKLYIYSCGPLKLDFRDSQPDPDSDPLGSEFICLSGAKSGKLLDPDSGGTDLCSH